MVLFDNRSEERIAGGGSPQKSREELLPPGWDMFRNGVDILASARSIYFLAEIRYITLRFDMI